MKSSFIAIVLLAATLVTAGSIFGQELTKDDEGLFTTPEQSASVPLKKGESLVVTIPAVVRGNLSVITEDVTSANLRFRKRAYTDSRSKAFDFIDVIGVTLTRSSGGATLECRAPATPDWKDDEYVSIELELTLPKGAILKIDAPKVHTIVEGPLAGVEITNAETELELFDITELATLSARQTAVKMERIAGKIQVQITGGTLALQEVTSTTVPARIESEGAEIRINGFKGEIDIDAEAGRIEISDFEPTGDKSSCRVSGAPLEIEISHIEKGRVALSNRGEDIELTVPTEIQAAFSLNVDEGSTISATRLHMRPDLVLPDRLNIVTGNGGIDIRASVRGSGNIYLRGYGSRE
jgi:hypothetical protein